MALADLLLKLESLNIPAIPPPGFEHLGFTITPGTVFHGGSFPSIVPDSAIAVVNIRLLPGQSSNEVLELVREQIRIVESKRPRIHLEMKVTVDIPGAYIPKDHPLAMLAQDYTEVVTGRRWATAGPGLPTKVICSSAREFPPCVVSVPPAAIRTPRTNGWRSTACPLPWPSSPV